MVRVPGSSGDSGFHRASQDVQVKIEQGDTQVSGFEVGKPRSKPVRKKMKAPDDEEDEDHHGSGWSEEDLKFTYHRKELRDFVDQDPVMRILKLKRFSDPKDPVTAPATLTNKFDATMELIRLVREAGMIPGSFDAVTLFDLDLDVIQATSRDLFQKLKILVGEVPQSTDPLPLTTTDAVDNLTVSTKYIAITNIVDEVLILHQDQRIGIWLAGDHVPRLPGFISIGSRCYMEWQNLALEATTDARSEDMGIEAPLETAVERPEYKTPRTVLQRPKTTAIKCRKFEASQDQDIPDCLPSNNSPSVKEALEDIDRITPDAWTTDPPVVENANVSDLDLTWNSDQDYDECVYYHEGSDLYAEAVDVQMAVLPEVPVTTNSKQIEEIQLCNALPPAARDVGCDIDVGEARPIALKCRKLRIQFREKLADLIKGLLSAKMIDYYRSPWASPIVVIIKKNGVDIRLCTDYRLVNSLTQLTIYIVPLINDLFEDLESTLWYCSLDMTSGFWVVTITDRAHLISAFVTPFGLFEWNRMLFGLKNAPQI
ncbi:reverse transcriptase [Phytophthora megakarya]|uniref:Reverse transcriptase n=1 Tax=Phytophthora megakarya TaxID=4795 RepID=A0A225VRI6_9STRA|nr:reverse transcriptase [Phytophthora megakarya]